MRTSLLLLAALLATGANAQTCSKPACVPCSECCDSNTCCDYRVADRNCGCDPFTHAIPGACQVEGALIPLPAQPPKCSELNVKPPEVSGGFCIMDGEEIGPAEDPPECNPFTTPGTPCGILWAPIDPTLAVVRCVDSVFANGAQVSICVVQGTFGNAPILECAAITLFPTNGNLPVQYVQCRGGIKLLEPEQCGANGLQSMNVDQTCTGGPLVPMDDEGLCVGNPAPTPDFDFFCPNNNCIDQFCRGEILKIRDGDYCYEPDADNCYCDCKANLVPIPGTGRHECEDLFNYALGTYTWPQSWPEQCMAHLVLIAPPPQAPQEIVLCSGDYSYKTVYSQRCKSRNDADRGRVSSCMMGSEGFSWCDTEHLFFRDDHWFDWDVCSLCHKGREHEPLTGSGLRCRGGNAVGGCRADWCPRGTRCAEDHIRGQSSAPRSPPCVWRPCSYTTDVCRCLVDSLDDGDYDYCTWCQGSQCPSPTTVPRDDRPGDQVDRIEWDD